MPRRKDKGRNDMRSKEVRKRENTDKEIWEKKMFLVWHHMYGLEDGGIKFRVRNIAIKEE